MTQALISTDQIMGKLWFLKSRIRPSIRNRVLCSRMLFYLHNRQYKLFFHPAKFDNFKDETISDYKTVSVPQSQILAGLKTGGLVGL